MSRESFLLPNGEGYRIKSDEYSRSRGGSSEMLDVRCARCSTKVLIYQKDGPGHLKRCYSDRIAFRFVNPDKESDEALLQCPQCDQMIGRRMIYKPESREAYGLVPGSFSKRKYIPEK
ncbi:MAG: hypothetical protein KIH89_002305 [Candidatus Shapirobacteria bacterium]|nr:hypothetical protein [Candidatus Shapirobacteria bacterium]